MLRADERARGEVEADPLSVVRVPERARDDLGRDLVDPQRRNSAARLLLQ